MYFDDMGVGFSYETDEREITEEEIIAFAQQWDPQPFHLDPEAARETHYGGLIASGLQTLAMAFRLTLDAGIWNESSAGSPGLDELRWRRPVRPGDRLKVRGQVTDMRPSRSKPERGMTEIAYEVLNQHGEVVMSYRAMHLLMRSPEALAEEAGEG
ncbi:acyl dehydratase [Aquicoccus sp. SCR17]|nr:acyl dehydratase [Carideicomes alvinocaridis]